MSELQAAIQAIEQDPTLREETNFIKRADAIDFLEFHSPASSDLLHALEAIDVALFERLSPVSSLSGIIQTYLSDYRAEPDSIGYDNLDTFVNGLLCPLPLPETTLPIEPEMVFYQKTPARIVFELVGLADFTPEDVFFDIGSGLGQVPILVNLLSGVTAKGVEYEPAYCAYASACAAALSLANPASSPSADAAHANVEFINTYAHNADYAVGTVFFMYTPFEGRMLQDMLEILKTEARQRPIRVFTYGPCSAWVARQDWLTCTNGAGDDPYKLYKFIQRH